MTQILRDALQNISWPTNVEIMDFVQILLIAFFVYHLMLCWWPGFLKCTQFSGFSKI